MKLRTLIAAVLVAVPAFSASMADGALTIRTIVRDDTIKPIYGFVDMMTTVLDSAGVPVVGLQQSDFQFNTMAMPAGSNCGLSLIKFEERQPGLYRMMAAQPFGNPNCQYLKGDYIQRIALVFPKAAGAIPVKVSYR